MEHYSILVNTCDKFEDCWDPFFRLFKFYWPDYTGTIYLNTEYKDYSYEGLNIVALKVCKEKSDAHLVTWSECLKRALGSIDSDIILYLQEDYFFKDFVKNNIVEEYTNLISENDIDCIHLTDQAVRGYKTSNFANLHAIPKKDKDRISCQAALWKKSILLQYLRSYESAWDFERFGSKRAAILKHIFLVVDNNWVKLNEFEIIPYVFTGVIRGKWYSEVVPLFMKHNIIVDYGQRGFHEVKKEALKIRILRKITRIPLVFRTRIDLFKLKIASE